MLDKEDWERLKEIRSEMNDLLEEAKNIVRMSGDKHEYERAKAYWLAYAENALDGPKSHLLPCTMGDTINALEPEEYDDEEWDDGEFDGPDSGEPDSGNSVLG